MVGNNWARMASISNPFAVDKVGPASPRRRKRKAKAVAAAGPKRRKRAAGGGLVRLKKGSAAAKAYMARIRKMRGKKR